MERTKNTTIANEEIAMARASLPASTDAAFFTVGSLSAYLGVPEKTIRNWRYMGEGGPPAVKLGGRVYFRGSDVDAWIEQQVEASR